MKLKEEEAAIHGVDKNKAKKKNKNVDLDSSIVALKPEKKNSKSQKINIIKKKKKQLSMIGSKKNRMN
jgi:stress response protein SCP2